MADARDEARLWYRDPTGDEAAARVDRVLRKARRGGKSAAQPVADDASSRRRGGR